MAEFRWILSGLGVLLIAGIWWWGARRSRQAPGNAQLREPSPGSIVTSGHAAMAGPAVDGHESRAWGVPPLEPLSIRTADFEPVPMMDSPMTATAEAFDMASATGAFHHPLATVPAMTMRVPEAEPEPEREPEPEAEPEPEFEAELPQQFEVEPAAEAVTPVEPAAARPVERQVVSPAAPAAPAARAAPAAPSQAPNTGETQRIVTIRVCALDDAAWAGADVLAALENHGLGFGRYKVFHRKHSDGRTLFCAASLVEPGTFDVTRMPEEQFRGLTLFAILPGPADALETVDTLIETAAALAETLQGSVQDSLGAPLSAPRAEAIREDIARFQRSLTVT